LQSALRCYVRARDYCTLPDHIVEMCMNVVQVSLELNNYAHVANYVAKAEATPDLKDKAILSKLKIATGLLFICLFVEFKNLME